MKALAPAKINLWLSVGSRRADGYHEILSVMQSVSLVDELEMQPAPETTLEVRPPGAAPEDETNLVVLATQALMAATGAAGGAGMRLHKKIPVAAGLGGGSADAAAALVGLNEMWRTGVSKKALEKIGARIGADVPFCVRGGTAIARGTGADLSPLSSPQPLWWVIAHGGGAKLSTRRVYEEFDRLGGPGLEDPYELVDALARADAARASQHLRNDLLQAAASVDPGVMRAGVLLRDAGAIGAVLAGAGPAWCGLARDEPQAREIAATLAGEIAWVDVAHSLAHGAKISER